MTTMSDREIYECTGIEPGCSEGHEKLMFHSLGTVCPRCHKHTGNNHQGHYWGLCKVYVEQGKGWKGSIREMHFCCPGNCELENPS